MVIRSCHRDSDAKGVEPVLKAVSNVTVRRRLFVLTIGVTLLFIALLLRLGYVQIAKGPELAELAEESWRRNIDFAASRGEIQDRNGETLVTNISTPTVMAIPAQIRDPEATAARLAEVLGMSADSVRSMITKRTRIVDIKPQGRKISQEKAQEVRDLALPGIVVAEDNKRYYPLGTFASHVLGFTGAYNQGLLGLELRYDDRLKGMNGTVSYLSTASGDAMPGTSDKYSAPIDGLNLQLTIDKQIQQFLERELDQAMLKHQPDQIIAIAMDPNNGEILAMASRPTFDPGNYQQYPADAYNRNLPVWMTYEPGSTFKIITLAAAIEEKKVDLKNEHFFDPGFVEVGGARLRCWKKGGHGSQTFMQVVENSCNPGFVALGNRLGKDKLFSYIRGFGFGSKTGVDLAGEASGILFKPEKVGPVELATTAFGQGVSVTPIQQISAISAAVNGGKLYTPHVAKAWVNPDTGETVERIEPERVRQVISEATSKQVRDALESVVAKGTGRNAFIEGYRVGGKTGTAQKVVNGRYSPSEHIVSFIGVAPANDPKIVVYVAVDNPQGIQFGGLIAAPIVRGVLADALPYMGVQPDYEGQLDRVLRREMGDVPYVDVPNLVGASVTDIYEDLNMNFQLVQHGQGSTVVNQSPAPGVRVERGSTIRIYLSDPLPDDHNH